MITFHFVMIVLLLLLGEYAIICSVNKSKHQIMAKVKDLAGALSDLNTKVGAIGSQLTKATGEITAEIETLKSALEDADIPEDAQASLDALTSKVNALAPVAQALDDLNPDAAPAPAPEPAPSPTPESGGTGESPA